MKRLFLVLCLALPSGATLFADDIEPPSILIMNDLCFSTDPDDAYMASPAINALNQWVYVSLEGRFAVLDCAALSLALTHCWNDYAGVFPDYHTEYEESLTVGLHLYPFGKALVGLSVGIKCVLGLSSLNGWTAPDKYAWGIEIGYTWRLESWLTITLGTTGYYIFLPDNPDSTFAGNYIVPHCKLGIVL